MSDVILGALIAAAAAVIVQLLANKSNQKTLYAELDKASAVTNTKLEELTREVREHNDFARRVPVMEEQIKVVNHRLNDLEQNERRSAS
jgi:hypothetical protein